MALKIAHFVRWDAPKSARPLAGRYGTAEKPTAADRHDLIGDLLGQIGPNWVILILFVDPVNNSV